MRLSKFIVAALFGTISAAALIMPAAAADKLRVGKSVPFAFAFTPVDIGNEIGIWKKYNIEPEISGFRGDAKLQQALTAGSVDIGLGSGAGMAFFAKGVPAKGVAAFAGKPYSIAVIIPYDSKIASLDELKGKKLGVTTVGSLTDWLAKRIGIVKGWGPDGVQTVPVGGLESSRAAMKTGQVDAIVSGAEVAYMLEKHKEAKALVTMDNFVDAYITHVIFARDELIKDNPDLLQRFVKGWFETVDFMRKNKEKTVEIVSKVLKQDKDVMNRTYDEQMKMLTDNGQFDPKAIEMLKKSFVEMGTIDKEPTTESMVTTKFIANDK